MPRAAAPRTKAAEAASLEMTCLEHRIRARVRGSRRISTSAKVLGLSKKDMTRLGMSAFRSMST